MSSEDSDPGFGDAEDLENLEENIEDSSENITGTGVNDGIIGRIVSLVTEPSRPDKVDWFERTIGEEEEIIIWSNPSAITLIPPVALVVLSYILLPTFILIFQGTFGGYLKYSLLVIPVLSLAALWKMILLTNTYYIVTTHEVIKKTGVISTSVRNAMYSNINNVDFSRSHFERLVSILGPFDIGDITVFTAGTDTSEIFLENVKDPETFSSQLKRFITSYSMAGKRHATTSEEEQEESN